MWTRFINRYALLLAFALSLSSVAVNGSTVYGYGTNSCGAWLKERQAQSATSRYFEVWVLGFLSGTGVMLESEGRKQRLTDVDGVVAFVNSHCEENPLDSINKAAMHLLVELIVR